MIPVAHYIGRYSLILAFVLGIVSILLLLTGRHRNHAHWVKMGFWALGGHLALIVAASASLIHALVTDTFSLRYVAERSSWTMPLVYKIGAFWGGQEGSLLLWLFMISMYGFLTTSRLRGQAPHLMPYVGAVMASTATFFGLLVVFVADPFALQIPAPADGNGLNPLLQDPSMMMHPLALYLGYTGLSVPFAFCIAALASRDSGADWIRLTRRWALTAWTFLSIGIMLGGHWAYHVLGWGGYWGWDPVENSSLVPWLIATAYLHSVMVQEKRGILKGWNVLLIIFTYVLTLFGTMLTRSGVLSSVHAFAESEIGPWFMGYIGLVLTGALYLIGQRSELLKAEHPIESSVSRESVFLLNNVVLTSAAFAILFGTVLPLVSPLWGVEISVGAPYFSRVSGPLFTILLLLMGIGPLLAWRRGTWKNLLRRLVSPLAFTGLFTFALILAGMENATVVIGLASAFFAISSVASEVYHGVRARTILTGENVWKTLPRLFNRNPRRYGGYLTHVAVGLIAMGVIASQFYQVEKRVGMRPGESTVVGPYVITFQGLDAATEGGVPAVIARLQVWEQGKKPRLIQPAQIYYPKFAAQQGPTTRIAVERTPARDLYVVLMGFDDAKNAGFEIFVNPMVSWIWVGGFLLVLGTLFSLWPRSMASSVALVEERVWTAWRDLEYDFHMGKIPQAEYEAMQAALLQDAKLLLGREELETPTGSPAAEVTDRTRQTNEPLMG